MLCQSCTSGWLPDCNTASNRTNCQISTIGKDRTRFHGLNKWQPGLGITGILPSPHGAVGRGGQEWNIISTSQRPDQIFMAGQATRRGCSIQRPAAEELISTTTDHPTRAGKPDNIPPHRLLKPHPLRLRRQIPDPHGLVLAR